MPLQNALLNMDEKEDDVLSMDDTPEEEGKEQGTCGHDVQKPSCPYSGKCEIHRNRG